jgi:hypothetical protein
MRMAKSASKTSKASKPRKPAPRTVANDGHLLTIDDQSKPLLVTAPDQTVYRVESKLLVTDCLPGYSEGTLSLFGTYTILTKQQG